jgi:hypothetical protein
MIGEIVFVANLSTAPVKRGYSQTFEKCSIEQLTNIDRFDPVNYTQTSFQTYNQYKSVEFKFTDFFENMKDLDIKERENYSYFLNSKKTLVKKSII